MTRDDTKINAGQAKQAAKTTIVGGQPPGNQRLLSEVPVGLEQLLAMAAASEDFARALREDPDSAVKASGLGLTTTELSVLRATPAPMLAKMTTRVAEALPRPERRIFLERAAAALAVLVGAATLGACMAGDKGAQGAKGSGATEPMDPMRPMESMQDATPNLRPMGMRPDPPRPMDAMERPMDVMKPVRPVQPPQAGATIERPPTLKTAGARKDRPMVPNKRPRPMDAPKSRGISHHRQRTRTGIRTGIRAGRGDDD
jgi:hypothetical protein